MQMHPVLNPSNPVVGHQTISLLSCREISLLPISSLTSIPLLAPIRQPTSAIFCTGSLGDFHASIQHLKHLGRSTKAEQMAPCHPQLHQPCSAEHTCPDAWQMDRYIGYSLNQCHSWLLLADRQKRKASCMDHSNGAIRPYLGTTALC